MKKIILPALIIFAVFTTGKAQHGYAFCATYNTQIALGDSVYLDLDGDGTSDILLYSVNTSFGITTEALSLKPDTGNAVYQMRFRFRENNYGYDFMRNYSSGTLITPALDINETYNSIGIVTSVHGVGTEFPGGSTGYAVYRRDLDRDHLLFCFGWIKFSVSAGTDSVLVESSCGCDQNNMVAGQISPETGIQSLTNIPIQCKQVGNTLVVTQNGAGGNNRFEVYNVLGQTLLSGNLSEGENSYDIGKFSQGLFFVTVTSEKGFKVGTYKLVK